MASCAIPLIRRFCRPAGRTAGGQCGALPLAAPVAVLQTTQGTPARLVIPGGQSVTVRFQLRCLRSPSRGPACPGSVQAARPPAPLTVELVGLANQTTTAALQVGTGCMVAEADVMSLCVAPVAAGQGWRCAHQADLSSHSRATSQPPSPSQL